MQTKHLTLIGGLVGVLLIVGVCLRGAPVSIGSTLRSPSLDRLSRLTEQDVDQLVIRSGEDEVALRKLEARWMIGDRGVYPDKLDAFWVLVGDLDSLPTIARNPDNHARLGVTELEATSVTFLDGVVTVAELLVGSWSSDSQSTFVRRPGTDAVAMVAGDLNVFLAPRFDEWRDPTIVDASSILVRSLKFKYPDEEFEVKLVIRSSANEFETTEQLLAQAATLTLEDTTIFSGQATPTPAPDPGRAAWVIQTARGEIAADPQRILLLLTLLTPLLADGFEDELWESLGQQEPAWTLEVGSGGFGSVAFLQFYPKDATTFYVRRAGSRDVFLLNESTAFYFQSRASDLSGLLSIEGGPSVAS